MPRLEQDRRGCDAQPSAPGAWCLESTLGSAYGWLGLSMMKHELICLMEAEDASISVSLHSGVPAPAPVSPISIHPLTIVSQQWRPPRGQLQRNDGFERPALPCPFFRAHRPRFVRVRMCVGGPTRTVPLARALIPISLIPFLLTHITGSVGEAVSSR